MNWWTKASFEWLRQDEKVNKPEPRFESEQEEDVCVTHVFFTNDTNRGLKTCDRGEILFGRILPNGPRNRHNCADKVRVGEILKEVNGEVVGGMNSARGSLPSTACRSECLSGQRTISS